MTNEQESIKERRGQTAKLIDHLLVERRQLLALLIKASDLKPSRPNPELLREFCQILVDYIAAGHFGLYERFIEKKERRKNIAELALEVYPRIEKATQLALVFNEEYARDGGVVDLGKIHEDLSKLGEELTNRIELEDKLICQLLQSGDTVHA